MLTGAPTAGAVGQTHIALTPVRALEHHLGVASGHRRVPLILS